MSASFSCIRGKENIMKKRMQAAHQTAYSDIEDQNKTKLFLK